MVVTFAYEGLGQIRITLDNVQHSYPVLSVLTWYKTGTICDIDKGVYRGSITDKFKDAIREVLFGPCTCFDTHSNWKECLIQHIIKDSQTIRFGDALLLAMLGQSKFLTDMLDAQNITDNPEEMFQEMYRYYTDECVYSSIHTVMVFARAVLLLPARGSVTKVAVRASP